MSSNREKTSPPFLNSFNCTATILSYVGRTTKVIPLLNALSKSTNKYLEAHAPYLNQFLKGPSMLTVIKFGRFEYGDLPHNWQLKAFAKRPVDLSRTFGPLRYFKSFNLSYVT